MEPAADSAALPPSPVPAVPAWATPRAGVREAQDELEAAYMAGGALNSLDALVRAQPEWLGAWRRRLALKAAAESVRLSGRREDEAALRDAFLLRRPGDEPGPAGNVLLAWRRLAGRSGAPDAQALNAVAGLLGVGPADAFGDLAGVAGELAASAAPAPLVAARLADVVARRGPGAEPLAWWMADLALSMRMRWLLPVPLLATQMHSPLLRSGEARLRCRPGDPQFGRAACLAAAAGAAAACRLGAAIDAQARRLRAVAPKLRSRGAGEVIALLLDEDAVSGSLTTATLSRWASRRLFERLMQFGAVRELSGRDGFRIYGL